MVVKNTYTVMKKWKGGASLWTSHIGSIVGSMLVNVGQCLANAYTVSPTLVQYGMLFGLLGYMLIGPC